MLYNILDMKGGIIMVVANYTAVRNNLKSYCDMAVDDGETVIIPRKEDRSVAIISLNGFLHGIVII